MTTIMVSSVIANKPFNGGNAWAVLSWVLGLRRLGFRVCLVEQIAAESCVDHAGAVTSFERSVNRAYFAAVVGRYGLTGSSALVYGDGEQVFGMSMAELRDTADAAGLLVNITGHLRLAPLLRRFRRRAYVDFDPGFTQFWHAQGSTGPHLDGHDVYFTVGENIGVAGCDIPTCGVGWRPVRQPVVLEHWSASETGDRGRLTTVASWRGAYGPVTYGGRTFGSKAHEFRKLIDLPSRVQQTLELALDIHPAEERDLAMLSRHGWRLVEPRAVASDPDRYFRYVQGSGGEFSTAQGIYVDTESGWFSDRTVKYLASGRPALVQDTGFSRNLPVGEGLVAFRTLDQAVAGAERIARDYDQHCHAARALAEEYFHSDVVLGRFLDEARLVA